MSEITLEGIAQVIQTELEPINATLSTLGGRLTTIEQILARQTSILDGLAKDVNKLTDEKTVTTHRLERLEHWAQDVGKKIGIKLEL